MKYFTTPKNKFNLNKLKSFLTAPYITDKSIQLLKNNKYIFFSYASCNKKLIKFIVKFIFNINCKKINVLNNKSNNNLKMFCKKIILTIK